ncbi:hypothetical protein CDO73_07175 [Saccharibacillus sp. O23]|uniref:J domain-containing protein n=1 Tax=Saccharibacillus sp. O23 TaxID=2009338 RepID=UPI000B4E41AA|nr:J domain-containing protein [Saccharibacillus sp. O23]OWR31499.1 hypothetical protein CDO73_07175 [Saccharibacillus sp. O23]
MGVWKILGIAPTADARTIKRAYAALLKKVHPEDDPEGFQRLREAYGEALELAKTLQAEASAGTIGPDSAADRSVQANTESAEDSEASYGSSGEAGRLPAWGEANRLTRRRRQEDRRSPDEGAGADGGERQTESMQSGPLEAAERVRRMQELYAEYARRIRPELWEELLGDERLRNLTFRREAQSDVLRFVAEHPHLPHAVWQVLDRTFDWTGDELGLVRSVPPEFAAFVLESIRQPAALRFEYVPSDPGFDQDEFLGLRARGAGLFRSGRLREAVEEWDRASELFAGDPDLLRLRAAALHLLGEDLRAEEDWRKLVAQFPDERDAFLRLADRLLETERASEALRLLQRALDLRPNDPQALLGLARCYRESERYMEAQHVCDLALMLEPSDIELRIRLLDLQSLQVQRLLEILKRYPGDRDSRYAAGELLYGLGRYEECERVLTEAPLYGSTGEMKALLGRTLLRLGREAEAEERFDEAVAASEAAGQNGYEARYRRGLHLAKRGEWRAAEADLRRAAALAPGENARLHAALADCLAGLGRFDEALESIGRALRIKPCSAFYGIRAVARHGLGQYEDALEDCERASEYRALDRRTLEVRAYCELRAGRDEEAAYSLEAARDLGGDSPELLAALCELYLRRGAYREVVAATAPYVSAESSADAAVEGELLLCRGWACRALGMSAEAEEAFVEAAKRLPDDVRALRSALDVLFADGGLRAEAVLSYAERILARDPRDAETRLRYAGALLDLGRADEALRTIEDLLDRPERPQEFAFVWYYAGAVEIERRDYAAAAERLRRACGEGLQSDAASLLSIALFETGETGEALRLAREVCARQTGQAVYGDRLKRMENRSGVPSALRLLMRRNSRQEDWPFDIRRLPLRPLPRGGEFPYEREVGPR